MESIASVYIRCKQVSFSGGGRWILDIYIFSVQTVQ